MTQNSKPQSLIRAQTYLLSHVVVRISRFALFLVLVWCLAIAYLCWELYWTLQQGLYSIKWHTHLAPFGFGLLFLITFCYYTKKVKNYHLILASILIALALAEALLFVKYTPKEQITLLQQYCVDKRNYYHVWPPSTIHTLQRENEFCYSRNSNSLGFADKEWALQKDSGKLRIITLGDSFTEGDGAPADSCYPTLLQNSLGPSYEVMNAGTCGSDFLFNYQNLQDRLLSYHPDLVVQTISNNDLWTDFPRFGGWERFGINHKLNTPELPAWLLWVAHSNIIRLMTEIIVFDVYTQPIEIQQTLIPMQNLQVNWFKRLDSLANENKFKVLLVALPLRHETIDNKYDAPIYVFSQPPSKNIDVVDLLPAYQAYIKSNGLPPKAYYWVLDAHHNSKGYSMMAQCISKVILGKKLDAKK